ncbi:MAG: fused MFS/spermidine synthase [Deltaproteobacteria bacterium]|nr:fused MFS/spermidine synthase [Deltaproteobacteria bacterium]
MPVKNRRAAGRGGVLLHLMLGVGGFAALGWEAIWQLQATLAFGVSAAGTALTLAATMGGMTLGSLAAGAWLRRNPPAAPLRVYAALELSIGLAGLLVRFGFRALEAFDAEVYAALPAVAPLLHGAGMALLIAPASFAMGASVPVFQRVAHVHGGSISTLYAANTAGAALGVLAMSFAVLPALGLAGACFTLAALNAAVCLAAWRLAVPSAARSAHAAAEGRASLRFVQALAVVFCTGFVTFGLEVTWFRALRAAFWSTSGTFAILLAAVLLPLAIGAHFVPACRRRGWAPGRLLMGAGGAAALATPLVERMDLTIGVPGGYGTAMLVWFVLTLLAIGPAIALLATALPWCLEEHTEVRRTSFLYACNALGSVAGSLLAAWLLLPRLGATRSAWLLSGIVFAAGFAVSPARRRTVALALGTACFALAVGTSSTPGRERVQFHRDLAGHSVLAYEESPDYTVSVVETPSGERMLFIDGFVATGDAAASSHYMEWMGRLPALLHPAPERGLVICLGTGQTANGLRREQLSAVDVVEVSKSVVELAPLFSRNEGVLDDPRVETIVMDGRAWLRRTARRYDVITLEPMPPNFAGVNSLYSLEFYEIMKQRLAPDGVVAQWLPIQLLTSSHARSVVHTFLTAFPDAVLWYDPVGGMPILLGRRGGASLPLAQRWPGVGRARRDMPPWAIDRSVWLRQPALARWAGNAELVTDDNQLLQWGQVRPSRSADVSAARQNTNLLSLAEAAGGMPFRGRRARPRGPSAP